MAAVVAKADYLQIGDTNRAPDPHRLGHVKPAGRAVGAPRG